MLTLVLCVATSGAATPRTPPPASTTTSQPQLRLLRHGERSAAGETCTFPDARSWRSHNATGPFPALDRSLTCAPGSVGAGTPAGSSYSLDAATGR
jgi:hypothetical protein